MANHRHLDGAANCCSHLSLCRFHTIYIYSKVIERYNVDMIQHFKLRDKHFRTLGHSFGIIIPKKVLEALMWTTKTKVRIDTTDNQIIITGPNMDKPKATKVSLFKKAEDDTV